MRPLIISFFDKPFIIQSMYFSHADKSFLVPETMELVVITNDLLQSLHKYLCVPSFLCLLRTAWTQPHKGQTRPLESLSFATKSSIFRALTKAGFNSIDLRLSCSAKVNLPISSNTSLIVGIRSQPLSILVSIMYYTLFIRKIQPFVVTKL